MQDRLDRELIARVRSLGCDQLADRQVGWRRGGAKANGVNLYPLGCSRFRSRGEFQPAVLSAIGQQYHPS